MNDRITDLLDQAADDGGTPLGFSGAGIVRRAQGRRRRRYGVAAAGLTAAAVSGVFLVGQLVASPGSVGDGPSTGPLGPGPRIARSTPPSPSASPRLTSVEQSVVDRCANTRLPRGQGRPGTAFTHVVGAGHSGSRTPASRAGYLRHWTLDAHVEDAQGVTATFVNPARTRWASCELVSGGTDSNDEVTDRGPVVHGPVPQSWYGPDGFRHQATGPEWAQVCEPGNAKICPRELYAGAFALYDGVQAIRVEAPDGTVLHPVLGTYTYVFRHTELRVAAHRAPDDSQPLPSMPVTLLDGRGHPIIRYDYYPSYIIPSGCPSTGGC
jgi:hypothetical protein